MKIDINKNIITEFYNSIGKNFYYKFLNGDLKHPFSKIDCVFGAYNESRETKTSCMEIYAVIEYVLGNDLIDRYCGGVYPKYENNSTWKKFSSNLHFKEGVEKEKFISETSKFIKDIEDFLNSVYKSFSNDTSSPVRHQNNDVLTFRTKYL